MRNLKITFNLDGTGVYYDPYEPIMLDALIAYINLPFVSTDKESFLTRDGIPEDISLPLKRWEIAGQWGYCASALFPDGTSAESLLMWRKKFRQNRIEKTQGSPNLQNGVYREYNMPLPLTLCHSMVAYAVGSQKQIHKALKRIKYLGKKRAYGRGIVLGVTVEEIGQDWSMVKDGKAMRYLPKSDGIRLVRTRPPYWNNHDKSYCCEIGDDYEL